MKGMNRIKRGTGFRGALDYVFGRDDAHKDEPGVLIGGNMTGATVPQLAREFAAVRALRPDIEKPVWHNALRLPEGETLPPERWQTLCDDYMQRMGFTPDHPRCYVMHDDAQGQHIHIVASRVSATGAVYLGRNENLISTRIIQRLERVYRLTLTQGATYTDDNKIVPPERKQAQQGEIEAALRTGILPPRLQLQQILDATLKRGPQTAPEFAHTLQAQGVTVVPNIASTGKMNGFSFGIDGVMFKGSALGANYKWASLKRIVHYDQNRDYAALADLRASEGHRAAIGAAPAGDRRTPDADSAEYRPGNGGPAAHHRDADRAVDAADRADAGQSVAVDPGTTTDERTRLDRRLDAPDRAVQRPANPPEEDKTSGSASDASRPGDAGRHQQPSASHAHTGHPADGLRRDSGGGADPRWDARFRRASAAKRAAADAAAAATTAAISPKRIDESTKQDARHADPVPYLEAQGFTVKREGRHASVRNSSGDEVYRLTQTAGRWVWSDHYGQDGGDTIALVRDIAPGTSFRDAVFELTGGAALVQRVQAPKPVPESPPTSPTALTLPAFQPHQRSAGRAYLAGRGISPATLDAAEAAGMLRYAPGAVLFVGYDEARQPRSATQRMLDDDATPNKRDLRGSVKAFCPILPGDAKTVWIVEGGTDALAVQDREGGDGQPPTVIVTGGAGVRSFLERPAIQALLRKAARVVIACENEKDAETQARTDAHHVQQRDQVRGIAPGADVQLWRPPAGCKDVAQLHARTVEVTDVAASLTAPPRQPGSTSVHRSPTPQQTAGDETRPS
jgi:hypothetical protein